MSSAIQEKNYWNKYYEEALKGDGQEAKQNLWWNIADRDLTQKIQSLFHQKKAITVMEAGCGSGISSFILAEKLNIEKLTLLDISPNALEFAKLRYHEKKLNIKDVDFIEGDIFDLKNFSASFDLVWNMGLIEHYSPQDIEKIIHQMFSAVKPGGYLVIGIPNRKSIAVLKAALLGSKFGRTYLNWIKGYKNETEILYSTEDLKKLITIKNYSELQFYYAGSPLWVNAPDFLVRFFDKMAKESPFSFLLFFCVKKEADVKL